MYYNKMRLLVPGCLLALTVGCATSSSPESTTESVADGIVTDTAAADNEPRVMPECGPGETLLCQTEKTGFGRLSTGRNTNYDYCSCEPSSVVIQDRPLPQY